MQKCCTEPTQRIENQETLCAPHIFEQTPEHPEWQHIEEKMRPPTVHKQMRDNLVWFEIYGTDIVKGEHLIYPTRLTISKYSLSKKY
jgi:hypothetical protein